MWKFFSRSKKTARPRHPEARNPPVQDFSDFSDAPFPTGAELYARIVPSLKRIGGESYVNHEPVIPPGWTDDARFYRWLKSQQLPRSLAEMLYYYAPERNFMAGSGYIYGVARIIEATEPSEGADTRFIRDAGFLMVGSGPNGDFLVVDLTGPSAGAVGFLPIEMVWGKSAEELRTMFIPICPTLGAYYDEYEKRRQICLPITGTRLSGVGNNNCQQAVNWCVPDAGILVDLATANKYLLATTPLRP